MATYRGGCHCGEIVFEVDGELVEAIECNCSICAKKGYLHWIVPRDQFRLLSSDDGIVTYSFNTGVAKHYFCAICGCAPYYIPRAAPEAIDVNIRCLDGVDIAQLKPGYFDGRNWEAAHREGVSYERPRVKQS
ncbi:MAG TPA: GFA family protein [Candidatus Binataceae bacterium]|nr:GFA family protein [Candidatus Binataceae bacterium]